LGAQPPPPPCFVSTKTSLFGGVGGVIKKNFCGGGGGGGKQIKLTTEDRENGDVGAVAHWSGVLDAAVIWYKKFHVVKFS